MPSGRADSLSELPEHIAALLERERFGVMSTIAADGSPHSVPVVFARVGDRIVSPIDHKPKRGEILARVKNIGRDDRVTLLIHYWDEVWEKVAWVMVRGRASVDEDAPTELMSALNERYPQYAPDEVHDALITIAPTRVSWWSWS